MWSFPLPETAIPLEEPANPRGSRSYRRIVDSGWEKCHIFWKKSQIIFEFDSFFGVESGSFFAEKSAQILRTSDFSSRTRKDVADFSAKDNCHFRPQETSRIWREIGIFLRKCGFFLIRRLRFSLWSGYLGDISQLVFKNYILGFRQMPHFLTKIPVSRQIRLVFWGRKWQFFPISGHSCRNLRRPP